MADFDNQNNNNRAPKVRVYYSGGRYGGGGGGYYDNKGNYVPPRPSNQSILIVGLTNALAMMIAEKLVGGLYFESLISLFLAAALFTLLNISIKPILQNAALPLTILTFALFALVLNGFLLWLVAWLIPGCGVIGFGAAVLSSIVISVSNMVIGWIIGRV